MSKHGKCANCYFYTKNYCSFHDRDVSRKNGCSDHKTLDEIVEESEMF